MSEADHYAKLWKGANKSGWHLFRIADGSVGKKPCDIAGVSIDGIGVCLEVKLHRSPLLPHPRWHMYAVHQIAWLKAYASVGAMAIAAEYSEYDKQMRLFVLTNEGNFDCTHLTGYADVATNSDEHSSWYAGWTLVSRIHAEASPWKELGR